MESVIRAAAVYGALLLIFRLMGKRSLAQITTFDFVLLLITSEAIQQAMIGQDFSLTNAVLVVLTLVGLDLAISMLSARVPRLERFIDSVPVVVVVDGKPLRDRMEKARLGVNDILEEARKAQGIERMDQIKYAVLEKSGSLSFIQKEG